MSENAARYTARSCMVFPVQLVYVFWFNDTNEMLPSSIQRRQHEEGVCEGEFDMREITRQDLWTIIDVELEVHHTHQSSPLPLFLSSSLRALETISLSSHNSSRIELG